MKSQSTSPQRIIVRPSAAPLSDVLAYKNPDVVGRIAHDHRIPTKQAESVFRDTLRFLYLAGATDVKPLAPTKMIDKGWHSFLMFTRDYETFCNTYFGRFIHHRPRCPSDAKPRVNPLAVTFDLARQFFGTSLSSNWKYDVQHDVEWSCEDDE